MTVSPVFLAASHQQSWGEENSGTSKPEGLSSHSPCLIQCYEVSEPRRNVEWVIGCYTEMKSI